MKTTIFGLFLSPFLFLSPASAQMYLGAQLGPIIATSGCIAIGETCVPEEEVEEICRDYENDARAVLALSTGGVSLFVELLGALCGQTIEVEESKERK